MWYRRSRTLRPIDFEGLGFYSNWIHAVTTAKRAASPLAQVDEEYKDFYGKLFQKIELNPKHVRLFLTVAGIVAEPELSRHGKDHISLFDEEN